MANRPSALPEWASTTYTENLEGGSFPNKSEPPEPLKQNGLLFEQGLAREHFNYQMGLIYEWIKFFDANLAPVGAPFLVDANASYTPPTGWTQDGTTTIGATTYNVYVRTV